jgi:hypothetical protein
MFFVGTPIYISPPERPAHPHLRLGMALAFGGIFVLTFGIEQSFQFTPCFFGVCSDILDLVPVGLGALLMVVGFVLMSITRKPEPPIIIYRSQS